MPKAIAAQYVNIQEKTNYSSDFDLYFLFKYILKKLQYGQLFNICICKDFYSRYCNNKVVTFNLGL